jgi:hypothetical protein
MERFQTLLTETLARFGGVDLKTHKNPSEVRVTIESSLPHAPRLSPAGCLCIPA